MPQTLINFVQVKLWGYNFPLVFPQRPIRSDNALAKQSLKLLVRRQTNEHKKCESQSRMHARHINFWIQESWPTDCSVKLTTIKRSVILNSKNKIILWIIVKISLHQISYLNWCEGNSKWWKKIFYFFIQKLHTRRHTD